MILSDDFAGRVRKALLPSMPGIDEPVLTELSGGASGVTLSAAVTDGTRTSLFVVRTIPVGLTATRNRDIVRQALVVEVLGRHGTVPVARVIAVDTGDPPLVPPFMITEFVEGDSFDPTAASGQLSRPFPEPASVRQRCLKAAALLARMHAVSPAELGLETEAVVTLEAETERWIHAFATVDAEYTEEAIVCGRELRCHLPPERPAVVVHGDYRLGNLVSEHGEVRAVIDWEIWSLGDPRLDLSWMASRYHRSHPSFPSRAVDFDDSLLPSDAELVDSYVGAGGAPPIDFGWFCSLAAFKQAAAGALIDKRSPLADRRRQGRIISLLAWSRARLGVDGMRRRRRSE